MEKSHSNYKWLITLTVMTGTIMSALDTSIVNVALPHMKGSFGAAVEEISWVSIGYILSNVIIMPIVALLAAWFGRKRFYIFSVSIFTIASMLCGIAWDLNSMIVFRILQGIGGGAIIPISQAILRETFPPKEQAMAMGIYGVGVILGPAVGPTLGGWLTDNYSWPWIFYINVPVGILNILLVTRFIEDPPYLVRERKKLDLPGLFFMVAGLGAFQIMLEKGEQKDWFSSHMIVVLAAVSVIGMVLFVWRELVTDSPAVDLRILKNANFSSATFLSGILGMTLMSCMFIGPLFFQQLLGYSAFDSGLTSFPRSMAMAIAMPLSGRIYNKIGPRWLIGAGLLINAVSFFQFSRYSLDVGYWDFFFPQVLQGIGFGIIFIALSTAALSSVEKKTLTAASGLYNVTRQVFGSIGIALVATLLNRNEHINRSVLMKHVTPFRDIATETYNALSSAVAGADAFAAKDVALKMLSGIVGRQASMLSFNHIYYLIAVVFAFSIPLIFLLKNSTKGTAEAVTNCPNTPQES